jgi:hypothetical protein
MLKNLLTIGSKSYANYDKNDIPGEIKKLASKLINDTRLVIDDEVYMFGELEAYLSDKNHIDPFVHCDLNQQTPFKWYFHKFNGKSYKGGSFKGMDLTFATQDKDGYCGMLVRSIHKLDDNNKIVSTVEGPCNVVDYILKENNSNSVKDFVEDHGIDVFKNKKLYLKKHNHGPNNTLNIYSGPRVGLTLKKDQTKAKHKYLMANYRYIVNPRLVAKYRTQMAYGLYLQGETSNSVEQITGVKGKKLKSHVDFVNDEVGDYEFTDFYNIGLKSNDLLLLMKLHDDDN